MTFYKQHVMVVRTHDDIKRLLCMQASCRSSFALEIKDLLYELALPSNVFFFEAKENLY